MELFHFTEDFFFLEGRSGESVPVKPLHTRRVYDTLSAGNIERSQSSADISPGHSMKSSTLQSWDDSAAKHDDKLPTFVSKLSSITVDEGEQAEFSCAVSTALFKFQKPEEINP